jgi:hypothetical protein
MLRIGHRHGFRIGVAIAGALAVIAGASPEAWGVQGHRLVALVATNHLTPAARQLVAQILPDEGLADVAVWADDMVADNSHTGPWHYVNIPADAPSYDRDRDCPRQPGAREGSRNDRWRDCVIDRILYFEERLGDSALDRADRATALKYLVHFIGDLHQPMHATGVARGGNGIPVVVFGSPDCTRSDGSSTPCNLHGVWDTSLIRRRDLTDQSYLDELTRQIERQRWDRLDPGSPTVWAMESLALSNDALLPPNGAVNEAYYRKHIAVIEKRLAMGGLRLAAVLNRRLTATARVTPRRRSSR